MNLKTYNPIEFRLFQRLDQLEKTIYKVKKSLLKWLIGTAFIVVMTEGFIYAVLHH